MNTHPCSLSLVSLCGGIGTLRKDRPVGLSARAECSFQARACQDLRCLAATELARWFCRGGSVGAFAVTKTVTSTAARTVTRTAARIVEATIAKPASAAAGRIKTAIETGTIPERSSFCRGSFDSSESSTCSNRRTFALLARGADSLRAWTCSLDRSLALSQ